MFARLDCERFTTSRSMFSGDAVLCTRSTNTTRVSRPCHALQYLTARPCVSRWCCQVQYLLGRSGRCLLDRPSDGRDHHGRPAGPRAAQLLPAERAGPVRPAAHLRPQPGQSGQPPTFGHSQVSSVGGGVGQWRYQRRCRPGAGAPLCRRSECCHRLPYDERRHTTPFCSHLQPPDAPRCFETDCLGCAVGRWLPGD